MPTWEKCTQATGRHNSRNDHETRPNNKQKTPMVQQMRETNAISTNENGHLWDTSGNY